MSVADLTFASVKDVSFVTSNNSAHGEKAFTALKGAMDFGQEFAVEKFNDLRAALAVKKEAALGNLSAAMAKMFGAKETPLGPDDLELAMKKVTGRFGEPSQSQQVAEAPAAQPLPGVRKSTQIT